MTGARTIVAAVRAVRDAARAAGELSVDDWVVLGERALLFVLVLALAVVGVYLSIRGPQ